MTVCVQRLVQHRRKLAFAEYLTLKQPDTCLTVQNYIFLDYDVLFAFGFLSDLSFKHSRFNEIVNFFSFHWHPTISKDCCVAL